MINKNMACGNSYRRQHPLTSEHRDPRPLSLSSFSPLVSVKEIAVKAQSNPEETITDPAANVRART